MNLMLRVRTIWDDLQSSLWYRPTLYTTLAIILALIAPYLDAWTESALPQISSDNARAVLSAIASSMLTVVTLTFSILMVSFTLASQQFSPRILRTFTRDRSSQRVMGIQISTFLYSLLVMARVNEPEDSQSVPLLSVMIGIGFALLGIGAFIYFVDHISRSIRVNYIIANIGDQTVALLDNFGQEEDAPAEADLDDSPLSTAEETMTLATKTAGYIQGIDTQRLVKLAETHDLYFKITRKRGDFVSKGQPLLLIHPTGNVDEELADSLREQFDIGEERTMFEDVLFGLRQLVDIALKAISPGINDPTTAMNCLDYMTNILVQAAGRPEPQGRACDSRGKVRVWMPCSGFADMVELSFHQIRHYGAGEPFVVKRMLGSLTEIAAATDEAERRGVLWHHVTMIRRSVNQMLTDPQDRYQVNECLIDAARQFGQPVTDLLLDKSEEQLTIL